MKVIFLDVDGVLNSQNNIVKEHNKGRRTSGRNIRLPVKALIYLKLLLWLTKSQIVLSSTWRKTQPEIDNLTKQLAYFKMQIYDMTPILNTSRSNEIWDWLSNNPNVTNFAILDDQPNMGEYTHSKLVRCSWIKGITLINVIHALKILHIFK